MFDRMQSNENGSKWTLIIEFRDQVGNNQLREIEKG